MARLALTRKLAFSFHEGRRSPGRYAERSPGQRGRLRPARAGDAADSWGVTSSGGSAWGDSYDYGTQNLTGTTQSIGASSATSTSTTSVGVTVGQSYKFLQPNILKVTDTITNTSGGALTGVKFQRNIDWDVAPTEFYENSFANPISGNVNDSTGYGFNNPDPAVPYSYADFSGGGNLTSDLGGGINVTLGSLAAGGSDTIVFLYGISQTGEDVNGLIGDVLSDGAYYWVATQSSENGAYPLLGANSAIIAVAQVPELSTWAMMGLGFAGLAFAGYRSRRSVAAIV